ncbi:MAG TPA: helix-turn-helix domain-containing protein [Pedobacter sp.]
MKNTVLAKKIKELRIRKGLSQEELSGLAQLNLRTVQRIENGETEPRGDTLKRLAGALNVTADELIIWTEEEDHTVLGLLNLSALGFIAFPLLGVIIPLALWMLKKDKVKYINETGKKLLNFQISWCIAIFLVYITLIFGKVFHIPLSLGHRVLSSNGSSIIVSQVEIMLVFLFGVPALYIFNLIMIIINTILSFKGRKVWYQPAVTFLR